MTENTPFFQINQGTKRYDGRKVLDNLCCTLESGSLGLLGPNGAGKSTLIKSLLGIVRLDEGEAFVLGHEVPREGLIVRSKIGYMPENDCHIPDLTAVNYLTYIGELYGLSRRESIRRGHEVLEYVGLQEARYRELGGFSTGMKQRVKLAQALLHGPKLLFLDEPTNGLDPVGREEMLDLLVDVKSNGISLVVSSHILQDVERICEQVLMINRGKVLFQGKISDIYETQVRKLSINFEVMHDEFRFVELLKQAGYTVEKERRYHRVVVRSLEQGDDILRLAMDSGIVLSHFVPTKYTLEAIYLDLMAVETDTTITTSSPL